MWISVSRSDRSSFSNFAGEYKSTAIAGKIREKPAILLVCEGKVDKEKETTENQGNKRKTKKIDKRKTHLSLAYFFGGKLKLSLCRGLVATTATNSVETATFGEG